MTKKDNWEDVLGGKKLVFLVGAPRSGTTWLQILLSRSPMVATAQETDLFNIFLRPLVDEWNHRRSTGKSRSLSEVLSENELRELLRNASGFVLAKIAHRKPSAPVILEKTPNHVQCWREILELWPGAHFIHIIRDPRSVVASRRAAVKNWGPSWGPSRISTICEMWMSFVTSGRQIRLATPNYREVSFEELTSNGPNALKRVFEQLGIPSCDDECRKYYEECSIANLKAGRINDAPFNLAEAGVYRFRTGQTESWRAELSKWEIALIERMAGPLMAELGFAPASVGGPVRLAVNLSCAWMDASGPVQRHWRRFFDRGQTDANLYGRLS